MMKRYFGNRLRWPLLGWPVCGLALCSLGAVAAPVPWLYTVDLAVEGRTEEARRAVSSAALAEVLSRISGLAPVPRNIEVRAALSRPETYYDRFVFLNERELRIHFSPAAVLKLVDEAKLPIWPANRPQVIAWLAVESGGGREIVDDEHLLGETLSARARQRGLVLKLPLMDLQDRLQVQPAVVWGRLYTVLEEASRRYGGEAVLLGRLRQQACGAVSPPTLTGIDPEALAPIAVHELSPRPGDKPATLELIDADELAPSSEDPAALETSDLEEPAPLAVDNPQSLPADETESTAADRSDQESLLAMTAQICASGVSTYYAGALEAWLNTEEFSTDFAVADVRDAGRVAVDFVADALAGRFAVFAHEPHRLLLTIGGVDSPIGYGRLLRYLDGLEFVSALDIVAVEGDRLQVALRTRARLEQLVDLLDHDGRIRRSQADAEILTWQGR